MKQSFSFIHTSDLHLNTPFSGIRKSGNEQLSKICKKANFQAFDHIVNIAIEREVDFVLIAGDLFDSENVNLKTQKYLFDKFNLLYRNDIKVYIVYGNHDCEECRPKNFDKKVISCKNVFLLNSSDKVDKVIVKDKKNEREIAQIFGISFKGKSNERDPMEFFPKKPSDSNLFTIGLLHSNVGYNKCYDNYSPTTIAKMKSKNYDYYALGHIHKNQILSEKNPTIIYSGCPQGRSFKETGKCGSYVINVNEYGQVNYEFVNCDNVLRWYTLLVDVTDCKDLDQVSQKICYEIQDLKNKNIEIETLIINIILEGQMDHELLEYSDQTIEEEVLELVEDSFENIYVQNIENRSVMSFDIESILKEDFFSCLLDIINDNDNIMLNIIETDATISNFRLFLSNYQNSENMEELFNENKIREEMKKEVLKMFCMQEAQRSKERAQ